MLSACTYCFRCPSKTPRLYKEYRNFMVARQREQPDRRLAFADVQRELAGDVNALHRWGEGGVGTCTSTLARCTLGGARRMTLSLSLILPHPVYRHHLVVTLLVKLVQIGTCHTGLSTASGSTRHIIDIK